MSNLMKQPFVEESLQYTFNLYPYTFLNLKISRNSEDLHLWRMTFKKNQSRIAETHQPKKMILIQLNLF